MNLKYLKFIKTVADEKSISKASSQLGVSQPNISLAIKSIEDAWQVKIFMRTNRGVYLTPGGEKVIREIESVLERTDELKRVIEQINRKYTIKIGTNKMFMLSSVCKNFEKNNQNEYQSIIISVNNEEKWVSILKENMVDLLIIFGTDKYKKFISSISESDDVEFIALGNQNATKTDMGYIYLKEKGMSPLTLKFLKELYENKK